jgi:hypothetical protein
MNVVALIATVVLVGVALVVVWGINRVVPKPWQPFVWIGFFAVSAVYFWTKYALQMARGEGGDWYSAATATLVAIGTFAQWRKGRA